MNPRRMPILRELFLQWRRNRALLPEGTAKRPFSRDWERLLEDAHLLSADARAEADRDARILEDLKLAEIRSVRYRRYQIERVTIPLAAEPQLRVLFADELPADGGSALDLATIDWHPHLAFLRTHRCSIATDDLLRLNAYFQKESKGKPVPLKERSLEIFGDEKRLDALRLTSLFDSARLTLGDLRCFAVVEPLGWHRGPQKDGPIIVLENLSSWHSYRVWNAQHAAFSATVYGGGNRFIDSAVGLADIFCELGGERPVVYFGDLDIQGLRIPQLATSATTDVGLPAILPHRWSYHQLLKGGAKTSPDELDTDSAMGSVFDWLGDLADVARTILRTEARRAQEYIGHDYLAKFTRADVSASLPRI